ncbi:hypothetical protein Q8A73_016509 [Channa argus]|nr:hypothetical protein Q8A73_016509 [Channa argus]
MQPVRPAAAGRLVRIPEKKKEQTQDEILDSRPSGGCDRVFIQLHVLEMRRHQAQQRRSDELSGWCADPLRRLVYLQRHLMIHTGLTELSSSFIEVAIRKREAKARCDLTSVYYHLKIIQKKMEDDSNIQGWPKCTLSCSFLCYHDNSFHLSQWVLGFDSALTFGPKPRASGQVLLTVQDFKRTSG